MRRRHMFVLALLGLIQLTMLPAYGERGIKVIGDLTHANQNLGSFRALIIGIDDYQDDNIPDLKTAVNDAREMAGVLASQYGFEVQLLLNREASRKGIDQALRKLVKSATANDSVLIYYAGHGDFDRTYNDGWWIPSDAKGGDPVTYIDNGQVQKAMRSMNARHALLISDSCYSGTLFGETRAIPKVIDEKYYLDLYNEKSRWAITSGNKTPVADDGTGGHSVFAYQFLKELRENRKPYVSTQEIYTRIAPIIGNNSEQTPMCRPMRNTGDQGGEFIFIASSGALVDAPAAAGEKTILSVTSNIRGAHVFLDNRLIGITDLANVEVSPGKHAVRVEMEGYLPYSSNVTFQQGREKSLHAILDLKGPSKGTLRITPIPANASIRILNITPKFYQGMELEPGRYHVDVSAAGYETQRLWVELSAGEDKEVGIPLNQIADSSPTGVINEAAEEIAVPAAASAGASDSGRNSLGMEFIYIKPGSFMMGSPESESERDWDETQHKVVLRKGFDIGKTEVTVGQFRKFVQEISRGNANQVYGDGYWENPGFTQDDTHPVTNVSWNEAQEFIKWLSRKEGRRYRLPTEAEWEYACRAGSSSSRFWGDDSSLACQYANGIDRSYKSGMFGWATKIKGSTYHKCDDGHKYTAPVAGFKPNAFGLYDMIGNVWEWCQDVYGDYSADNASAEPKDASEVTSRVVRGGGWESKPQYCRSADRLNYPSDTRYNGIGFRVVRD